MSTFKLKTMIAAVLVGSLAFAGPALARMDEQMFDPAKGAQRIEKRVDRALSSTDATAEQKKQISTILQSAFADLRPLREKGIESRKAMVDVLQAPAIDRLKVEQLRQDQIKMVDEASKRLTKALQDAGDILTPAQRQAFFKAWGDRLVHGKRPG